jgi:hypothetical protein
MLSPTTSKPAANAHSKYRWVENAHIFLWLIKDTCWAMVWRPGGVFMIFPTLAVAFFILWKSRRHRAELFHNAAVCLWISANSVWMIGEFWAKETRPAAVVLFMCGLALLIIYYSFFFHKDRRAELKADAVKS